MRTRLARLRWTKKEQEKAQRHSHTPLQFSGNPSADFHECGLIDIPAFTVSIQKSGSNGKVEAIPNPADAGATQWVRDFASLYPEESEKMVIVTGDLPSFATLENLFTAAAAKEGLELLPNVEYPFTGAPDWGPYADAVMLNAAAILMIAGKAPNMMDGVALARSTVARGEAMRKLEQLVEMSYDDE